MQYCIHLYAIAYLNIIYYTYEQYNIQMYFGQVEMINVNCDSMIRIHMNIGGGYYCGL